MRDSRGAPEACLIVDRLPHVLHDGGAHREPRVVAQSLPLVRVEPSLHSLSPQLLRRVVADDERVGQQSLPDSRDKIAPSLLYQRRDINVRLVDGGPLDDGAEAHQDLYDFFPSVPVLGQVRLTPLLRHFDQHDLRAL